MPTYVTDKFLAARFGVSRATIWVWNRDPAFPKPVILSAACTRWKLHEVEAWEAARAAARPTATAAA